MRTSAASEHRLERLVGRRVVCAANRDHFTGDVVIGVRHHDKIMREQMRLSGGFFGDPLEQGFIDQDGTFMTRSEAWKVAEAAGQIIRRCGGDDANGGTLYSENLY